MDISILDGINFAPDFNTSLDTRFDIDANIFVRGAADIAIENVNINFKNLFEATFESISLPSMLFSIGTRIWSAQVERERHRELTRLLTEIVNQLRQLNRTVSQIQDTLRLLPDEIAQRVRAEYDDADMHRRCIRLENVSRQLYIDDYVISRQGFEDYLEDFAIVAQSSTRLDQLMRLPLAAETINYLSAGSYANYVRDTLAYPIEAVSSRQASHSQNAHKIFSTYISPDPALSRDPNHMDEEAATEYFHRTMRLRRGEFTHENETYYGDIFSIYNLKSAGEPYTYAKVDIHVPNPLTSLRDITFTFTDTGLRRPAHRLEKLQSPTPFWKDRRGVPANSFNERRHVVQTCHEEMCSRFEESIRRSKACNEVRLTLLGVGATDYEEKYRGRNARIA
ncbi:MAG: hypothetical protein AAF662_03915 [Pseudomonadota bacterium]